MSEEKMSDPNPADSVDDGGGYTPTFDARTRRIIYVLGVVCSVMAVVLAVLSTDLGWPKWTIDLVAALGPMLPGVANAFGVHYAGVGK